MRTTPLAEDSAHSIDRDTHQRLLLLFCSTALLAGSALSGWLRPDQESVANLLALAGTLLVAMPIVAGVFTAIRSTGFSATQFYMDQYVVIALAACLATGRYLTGGIVATVLAFGQILEERTTLGVEMALSKLKALSRLRARRRKADGAEEAVDATDLREGDEITLRTGEMAPADAVVLSGHALVDQSNITGESIPVECGPGDEIYAGTLNTNGALVARVSNTGADTLVGRLQKIIEEAKSSEAPIISLAEDYARYYTPLILLIAACVFFFTQDMSRAIAVLVVSIPCAFVLASPSAMVSAIAAASRLGLLVKSVRRFETARRVDTIVFDKTGTLTQGKLELDATTLHDPNFTEQDALRIAATIESGSNHPIARAIATAWTAGVLPQPEDLTEEPGLGIRAMVDGRQAAIGRISWLQRNGITSAVDLDAHRRHSLVGLALDGKHVATFLLSDTVRPEARATIQSLRDLGIENFVMLTGDRPEVAAHIAETVGLKTFHAECLPEDKVARIRALKAAGHRVMVVGDGLNDAPALAEADFGVAVGGLGNDITVHTSDVALMGNDLRRLPDLLVLSARTVGIINQNLLCGFLLILLAITASSLGWLGPIGAAVFHEFSAFFVIFNSARLLRFDGNPTERITPSSAPSTPSAPLPGPVPA